MLSKLMKSLGYVKYSEAKEKIETLETNIKSMLDYTKALEDVILQQRKDEALIVFGDGTMVQDVLLNKDQKLIISPYATRTCVRGITWNS